MARSVETIYEELLPKVKTALGIADNTIISAVSLEGMLVYAFAFVTNLLEQIFDDYQTEIDATVASLKPHSLNWYSDKVKAFQYGYSVDVTTGDYDNSALTEEEIEASKMIDLVAVVETENYLRIKTATQGADDLEQVSPEVLIALEDYLSRIKDAGVKLLVQSLPPDDLRISADIYVDPLLFRADGTLVDGSDPIRDAIANYLVNLPFNGVFALALLVDEIQNVPGVVVPHIVSAEWRYGDLPYTSIGALITPDSGYLRFAEEDDLNLNFIFQNPI